MRGIAALVVVVMLSVAAAQQPAESVAKGVIYGTVTDQDGQPAKDLGLTASEWAKSAGEGIPLNMHSGSSLTLDVELDPSD